MSAAARSSTPSKHTRRWPPCGRTSRTRYVTPSRSKTTASGRQRSGLSERFWTETSPRIPCGLATTPTTIVGRSTSVLEFDPDGDVLPRGRRADDGPDRLRRPPAPADHLAELPRADLH